MASEDLLRLSALEQAELIRQGALGVEELTRQYLQRIDRHNPSLTALVSVSHRRSVWAARRLDRERRQPAARSPLWGVPTGVKDLNFVRGMRTRMGARPFAHVVAPVDDLVVRRLRAAGMIILGKLATSELGTMPVTEPDTHPPTRNPWNLGHSAGGSSGGSGAAVAALLLPIAQGSDGAGSIRIPASFCHLFGYKPSRGLLPNAYGYKDPEVIYTNGPLSRTVADAAAMVDAMAARPVVPSLLSSLTSPPPPLRIRFVLRSPLVDAEPAIATAVKGALRTLELLGHEVEEGDPPRGSLEEFLPVWQVLARGAALWGRHQMQPITRWLIEGGRGVSKADALHRQRGLAERLREWWSDADLWVTPTVAVPPPVVGAWRRLPPQEGFAQAARLGAFTALFNLTGQPAVTIPLGLGPDGLPMGLQVAARLGADALLLRVARQLEEAMPWRGLTPPLWTPWGVQPGTGADAPG